MQSNYSPDPHDQPGTMRLIDVGTLQLEETTDGGNTPYAVLSHTWRQPSEGGEVKFHDFQRASSSGEPISTGSLDNHGGFQKVKGICEKAASHGLKHAWADTCCIDQTSPAELSRSINSMFRWYKESTECLVYLADVTKSNNDDESWITQFRASRWFERGWTLQELIAPSTVIFYDCNWTRLGTRDELHSIISEISAIPRVILTDGVAVLPMLCVAQKMALAARRQTTAPEDASYCLLGLFDVNMPLVYGEGSERAFRRL